MTKFFKTLLLVGALGATGCNISGSFIEECVANLLTWFSLGDDKGDFKELVPSVFIGYYQHDADGNHEFVGADELTNGEMWDRYLAEGTYDVVYWGNVGTRYTAFADVETTLTRVGTRAGTPRVTYKTLGGATVGNVDRVWFAISENISVIDTPTRVLERSTVEFSEGYRSVNIYIKSDPKNDEEVAIPLQDFSTVQLTSLPSAQDYFGATALSDRVTAELAAKDYSDEVDGKPYRLTSFDTFRFVEDDLADIRIVVKDTAGEEITSKTLQGALEEINTRTTRALDPNAQTMNIEMNIVKMPTIDGGQAVSVTIDVKGWEQEDVTPHVDLR